MSERMLKRASEDIRFAHRELRRSLEAGAEERLTSERWGGLSPADWHLAFARDAEEALARVKLAALARPAPGSEGGPLAGPTPTERAAYHWMATTWRLPRGEAPLHAPDTSALVCDAAALRERHLAWAAAWTAFLAGLAPARAKLVRAQHPRFGPLAVPGWSRWLAVRARDLTLRFGPSEG